MRVRSPIRLAVEYRAGRPAQAHLARFDRGQGQRGGMYQVAQFVGEGAEPLVQGAHSFFRKQHIVPIGIFRDGLVNREAVLQ